MQNEEKREKNHSPEEKVLNVLTERNQDDHPPDILQKLAETDSTESQMNQRKKTEVLNLIIAAAEADPDVLKKLFEESDDEETREEIEKLERMIEQESTDFKENEKDIILSIITLYKNKNKVLDLKNDFQDDSKIEQLLTDENDESYQQLADILRQEMQKITGGDIDEETAELLTIIALTLAYPNHQENIQKLATFFYEDISVNDLDQFHQSLSRSGYGGASRALANRFANGNFNRYVFLIPWLSLTK